jgi:pilus assembly protein CpaB
MDRQKVLIIFGVALVCALALSWFVLAQARGGQSEKYRKIVAAARDLPAGTRLKKGDLKLVGVSERDVPRTALFDDKLAVDRALLFPMNANEPLTVTKMTSSSGAEGVAVLIEPGKRAVSVPITDASSAGGLIQPRSRVDVLFTRPGAMAEAITTTLIEDVPVLSVGKNTEVAAPQPAPAGGGAVTTQRPPAATSATLMVTPDQARKIELAKAQGRVGLVLRNPLDHTAAVDREPATAETLDPMLAQMGLRRRIMAGKNLRDDRAWNRLIGGEPDTPARPAPRPVVKKAPPPKPRWTVDVYRGDKHVQEIFQ